MAAAVHAMQSSAASSSSTLQGASTTAAVVEFVCLFTHDLRRKQKRWQDGRLKYHTFNKRVMVYDERGNFVGDAHWREDYPLCDGEELQLERGGVIVQVTECTGSREQDLSELVDKRAQEKAQRQSAALARRHPTLEPPTPQPAVVAAAHFQPRHRPLHQLIGTPTGHHGRALIPSESPYQQRQQQLEASPNQDDANHPAKRRKRDISPPSKSGYAQSLFGTTLTLSGCPMSSAPMRRRPVSTPLTRRGDPCPTSSDRSNRDNDMESAPLAPRPAAALEQRGAVSAGSRSTNIRQRVLASPPRKNVESRRASTPIIIEDAPERYQSSDIAQGHISTSLKGRKDSQVSGEKKRNHLQPAPANETPANETQTLASDAKRASDGDNPKDRPLDIDYASKVIKWREERRRAAEISQPGVRRGANAEPALHTKKDSRDVMSASRSSKEIDVTKMAEKGPDGRVPTNEPKTELRIRPRKKPGLLMLSDKTSVTGPNQKRKSIAAKDIPEPEPLKEIDSNMRRSRFMDSEDSGFQALDSGDRQKRNIRTQKHDTDRQNSVVVEEVTEIDKDELKLSERDFARNTARSKLKTRDRASKTSSKPLRSTSGGAVASGDESVEEMEGTPPRKGSRRKRPKTVVIEDEDDTPPEILERRSRRPKRARKSSTISRNYRSEEPDSSPHSEEEEVELSEEDPTPRLAKIKNGIRTREIIGFVFDDEDDEEDCGETNVPADDKPNEVHHPPGGLRAQGRAVPDAAVLQDFKAAAPPQMTMQLSSKQDDSSPHVTEDVQVGSSSKKDNEPSSGCPMDQTTTAAALPTDISSQGHGRGQDTSPAEPQLCLTHPQGSEHPTKPSLSDESGAQQAILRDADPTIRHPPCISDNPQRQDKPVQDVPGLGGNVQGAAPTEVEAALSKAVVARRTINPASRGKKAAKPSDAAGQLPQCPLPPEARSIGAPRPMIGKKPDEARKEDKGVATPLPGFAKANGGPWSREAFDLFEFKRPT